MALLTAFTLTAVDAAQARSGGSFGSRGVRTFQTVPSTPTMPGATAPIQRSMNTPSQNNSFGTPASNFGRGGFFNGIGGWLVGGLLFSGLFGLMFGGGFGGIGGILSLLIQLAIVFFVVRWLFGRFGRRTANAGPSSYNYDYQQSQPSQGWPGSGSGYGFGSSGPRSEASNRAGGRDELGVSNADLKTFEQRLSQLQDAYSREDYDALRRITTPEVMSYLTEELAQSAVKGLRNEVFDVRLLQGDVAEAWREGSDQYATIALRYESRDVMRERATGALASGEDRVLEHSEVWTFVRHQGGDWLISAIQS